MIDIFYSDLILQMQTIKLFKVKDSYCVEILNFKCLLIAFVK